MGRTAPSPPAWRNDQPRRGGLFPWGWTHHGPKASTALQPRRHPGDELTGAAQGPRVQACAGRRSTPGHTGRPEGQPLSSGSQVPGDACVRGPAARGRLPVLRGPFTLPPSVRGPLDTWALISAVDTLPQSRAPDDLVSGRREWPGRPCPPLVLRTRASRTGPRPQPAGAETVGVSAAVEKGLPERAPRSLLKPEALDVFWNRGVFGVHKGGVHVFLHPQHPRRVAAVTPGG